MKRNRKVYRFLIFTGMALVVTLRANAAYIYWDGSGENDDWTNSVNWRGNKIPVAGDRVFVGSSDNEDALKQAVAVIQNPETCLSLTMANGAGTQGRLIIVDGGLTAGQFIFVGSSDTNLFACEASIVHSNGAVDVTTDLMLGRTASATGSYEIVSGSLDVAGKIYANYAGGSGTFIQRGGSVASGYLWVGHGGGGSGRYELHDGTLVSGRECVGVIAQGKGFFLHADGTNQANVLLIGEHAGSSGEYQMCGGLLRVMNESGFTIAYSGTGVFNQSGGKVIVEKNLNVGYVSGSEGFYHFSGGELQFTNSCTIALGRYSNGTGTFRLGDTNGTGAFVKGNDDVNFYVRNDETSDGTLEGWGSMPDLILRNSGRVIADGYGTERVLDLSTLMTLVNKNAGLTYSSTHGWFARNCGALRLMDISASADFCWGDLSSSFGKTDKGQPLVNSVKFSCTGASGILTGRLLAPDHDDVHPGLDHAFSIWDFSGVTYDTATVTIRYDDLAAAACGVVDEDLRVFQHDGSGWRNRTASIDPVTKTITASLLSPFSQIAVAQMRFGTVLIIN